MKVKIYQMSVFYVGNKMFIPDYEKGETSKQCYKRALAYAETLRK